MTTEETDLSKLLIKDVTNKSLKINKRYQEIIKKINSLNVKSNLTFDEIVEKRALTYEKISIEQTITEDIIRIIDSKRFYMFADILQPPANKL